MNKDYERRLLMSMGGITSPRSPFLLDAQTSPRTSIVANLFHSPVKSSPYNSKPEYSDRFIPVHEPDNWDIRYNMIKDVTKSPAAKKSKEATSEVYKNGLAYQCLLKNELLGAEITDINEYRHADERKAFTPRDNRNVFRYRSREVRSADPTSPYSYSPISLKSQKMLRSPRKTARKISKIPFKVLDAPELQDDFYLNLVDWSSTNILSVGLGTCVYLWSASTSQVTRLCDFSATSNPVTSVSWSERGNLVAVGTHRGFVQIWDVSANKMVRQMDGHNSAKPPGRGIEFPGSARGSAGIC